MHRRAQSVSTSPPLSEAGKAFFGQSLMSTSSTKGVRSTVVYQDMLPVELLGDFAPSTAPQPRLTYQLRVVVGFVRSGPADPPVPPGPVLVPSQFAEFQLEVAWRSESNLPVELLGNDSMKPLELPSSSGVVGPSIDYGDTPSCAVCSKLIGDETTPAVDV